jgi:hypothetical protein
MLSARYPSYLLSRTTPTSSRPMMAGNRPMTANPRSFFLLRPRTIARLRRRLTLVTALLVALCNLTIPLSPTVILSTISTVHSTSFRPIRIRVMAISLMTTRALVVVHLVPAWHFPSGTSYPRMLKISGTTYQMRLTTWFIWTFNLLTSLLVVLVQIGSSR